MGKNQPYLLGDGTRILRPGPQVDVPGIQRLHQVRVDALQRAAMADDALDNLRRLSVAGDSVEVEPHTVEDAHPQRVREAPPAPQANVDAAALKAPTASCLLAVLLTFEPDEVRLRLMNGDGDGTPLQLEGFQQ